VSVPSVVPLMALVYISDKKKNESHNNPQVGKLASKSKIH